MVPSPEPSYFPSLDKCLNGDEILISWRAVYSAIQVAREDPTLQPKIAHFLADPTVRELLFNPFKPSSATPQSKSSFETKTSAINVTPSSDARYGIKEVKGDALWLSKVGKLDEVSALRIVVQECQGRTAAKLLGRFSEDELAGIRDSAGDSKFSSPMTVSLLSRGADVAEIHAEFETEDNRRQRILLLYLSERRYFWKCCECLIHEHLFASLSATENGRVEHARTPLSWLGDAARVLGQVVEKSREDIVLQCIASIESNLQNAGRSSGWYDGTKSELESDWVRTQFTEATHLMEILFELLFNADFPSSQVILRWFRLLCHYDFFSQITMEDPSLQTLILPFQSISMMVSLSILSLGPILHFIQDESLTYTVTENGEDGAPFILNTSTLTTMNEIMMAAADAGYVTAGPPILAWGSILRALNFRVSNAVPDDDSDIYPTISSDPYSTLIKNIMENNHEDNPIDYLARRSVNGCHVLETLGGLAMRLGNTSDAFFPTSTGSILRTVIIDTIASSGLGYIPEVVEALLSALRGGQNYWDLVDSKDSIGSYDLIAMFMSNPGWVNTFLQTAMSRYPCESLPFLRIVHAIASSPSTYGGENPDSAIGLLSQIPYFTYQIPGDFIGYETVQEEDNNNSIRLRTTVDLFEVRSMAIHDRDQSQELELVDKDFCIPVGTTGRVISDSGPRVILWFHEYSGLKYFGRLLETFLTASDVVDAITGFPADEDSVAEIIDILATLLYGTSAAGISNPNAKEDSQLVLELASSGLSRNRDVITVVFAIFEEELQRQSKVSGSEVPLAVLVSCVHFIHALLLISPGRVWPYLAQSALLGVSRGGGRLSNIVEGVELVSGRYEFLLSCTRLYEALVEDVTRNAIRRRSRPKSTTRFHDEEDVSPGIPDHVLSKTLLHFTRYLMDVLESSFSWKFVTQNDRRRLTQDISTTFNKILHYVYGTEAAPRPDKSPIPTIEEVRPSPRISKFKLKKSKETSSKITAALTACASQIVESFLATSSSALRFQPILVALLDGLETPDLTIFTNELTLWIAQVESVLSFSTTLLRVSNALQKYSTDLERQLFKAAPLIARLYAVCDAYKRPVVSLCEALVVTANNMPESPSLLGHLGPYTAKNFLHILSDLDKPLSRDSNSTAIWHFLSMVVSNKQQWFANYLLTGTTPREEVVKSGGSSNGASPLDKPLLTVALERLLDISGLPKTEALAMLEFVALSQNFWPWSVYNSAKHADFITSIAEYAGNLQPLQHTTKVEETLDSCYQIRIAAYIAEILAMHMFHSRQTRTSSLIPDLIANLSYYTRFAVVVPGFNSSLHAQLKRNFDARYSCSLLDLKRTTLEERQLGRNYFYNLPLANKMLRHDEGWTGRKHSGLRAEVEIANVNLSLVDAQIALFHGWKVLAIELTSSSSSDVDVQKALIKVSCDSLESNTKSHHSEEIFTRLCAQRADFALIITQRMVEAECKHPYMKNLLSTAWETIRNFRGPFEKSLRGEESTYYRSLLKLLFIATRAHIASAIEMRNEDLNVSVRMENATPMIPVVLDIIKYVVAMGFREYATKIHENSSDASPEDIALITGILQSCLRMPGIELCQAQILGYMKENDTARMATTLFSWSDSIAVDGDPIYGELSMLFLLELSSMPLMAEQLAIDGVLGHIASANIISYLRRGNVSPFADGTGLQRCYSIWAKGILPLLLNLLDAVQSSIAAEVAIFLNQFSHLLEQCSKAFEAPESSRTVSKSTPRYISLGMCSEAHSLALLNFILTGLRESGGGAIDIPEVKLDSPAILENVEFWLGARVVLRERIIPMGARDVELSKQKTSSLDGVATNRLEEAVVSELMGIRDVLGGVDSS
ncbi:nucleoporin-like protein [Amylocarpus encephaloides]|uniref:Nucleoporin NUP188 n=1 Tax=Amylocarpus encephaloides TaxID=45428 RepID=A0A9P7Y993_9HELO|nr:nucleoporin-like protein [Amylocarpus encephaloides]